MSKVNDPNPVFIEAWKTENIVLEGDTVPVQEEVKSPEVKPAKEFNPSSSGVFRIVKKGGTLDLVEEGQQTEKA